MVTFTGVPQKRLLQAIKVGSLTRWCCVVAMHVMLIQVSSKVHVYGHSHRCIDTTLKYTFSAPQGAPPTASSSTMKSVGSSIAGPVKQAQQVSSSSGHSQQQEQQERCRFVQYALDAVGAEAAGLYCIWDGYQLAPAGHVVPIL